MTESLRQKLIEATIKADNLVEQVTGQKGVVVDQINEMYVNNRPVEEMITYLSEGIFSGLAGSVGQVFYNLKNPTIQQSIPQTRPQIDNPAEDDDEPENEPEAQEQNQEAQLEPKLNASEPELTQDNDREGDQL